MLPGDAQEILCSIYDSFVLKRIKKKLLNKSVMLKTSKGNSLVVQWL